MGILVAGGLLYTGYEAGQANAPSAMTGELPELRRTLEAHRSALQKAQVVAERRMATTAAHLGRLQARIVRLEALGGRLARSMGVDEREIELIDLPPVGGYVHPSQETDLSTEEFRGLLAELSEQIENWEQRLRALDTIAGIRDLRDQSIPLGKPLAEGWISSGFGYRVHPISGKRHFHGGIDMAGRANSPIVAVAAGIVTASARKPGYGNLLEIDHGNGLVTRYGHNSKHLVRAGDTVRRGQVIAIMGSTGTSTGPHVHFEVRKDGKVVDPTQYVRASH